MVNRHEAILKEDAIISGETMPPLAEALIDLAEEMRGDQSFAEKYPDLGWISFADAKAKTERALNNMTIYDDLVWAGYKRAHGFDPKTASQVTPEDLGIDQSALLGEGDEEDQADPGN